MLASLYILVAKVVEEGLGSNDEVCRCDCPNCATKHALRDIVSTRRLEDITNHPLTGPYRQRVKKLILSIAKKLGAGAQGDTTERDVEGDRPNGLPVYVPGEEYRNSRLLRLEPDRGRRREGGSPMPPSSIRSSFSRSRSPRMLVPPQAAVTRSDIRQRARSA